ncbi:MAG TPA: DUF1579 family protein [Vicinamibacterales bacterium]|nr:DUF1579 family protein [Vicinamibacterales bacterium]
MLNRVLGSGLVVLAFGGLVLAQPQAPKPGPEHKALGYFVGKWTSEGEMKAGPLGPGGKVTSNDSCEWFKGSFQVVCRGEGTGPMGPMTSLGVMAYSAPDKAYTYYGIDNMGTSELSHGQKKGTTWIFTATSYMEGKQFESRYTIVETSPSSYTFKWEMSTDKKTWAVALEGKATKAS